MDITPFANAAASLKRALERHVREPSDEEVRDSVIQRFEFTYDLSHKMLRRVLEHVMADTELIPHMSFPTLIRTGWEQGIVPSSWPTWEEFRKLRNVTSHTYDREKAIDVASRVPAFFEEASELLHRLQERLTE